jgi:hypothetical protein
MISNPHSTPSSFSIHDRNSLCQHYLDILYRKISVFHAEVNASKNNIPETYGEIFYSGVEKLLSSITLTPEDVFADLGSGIGKIVLHAFLRSPVKEARGIELLPELHEQAIKVEGKVRQDLPEFYAESRQTRFLLGSFLELPLTDVTVALICSACFSQTMLLELGRYIDKTPSIHTVLTLRPLDTLERLPFKKAVRIECSWDTALCYIYSKK